MRGNKELKILFRTGLILGTLMLFVLPNQAFAALSYVGTAEASGASAAYNVTLPAMQQGDLVIVATGFVSTANGDPGVSTAGYAEVADLYASDSDDANLSVNWKIMGATPDSTVTCLGSGSATNGAGCVVHVWRGANQTTPLDVTTTTVVPGNNIGSSIPNSPAITPVTSGAIVIAVGLGADAAADTSVIAPTGYSNQADISTDPGLAYILGIASKAWSGSGAEDPAVWTTWTSTTAGSWAAATLAIRPATVPGAPTIGTATAGDTQASVAFSAPASDGGSPITGYTVTSTPGSFTGTGSASPIIVTGLTNGTAYTFTVHATNAIGNSAESAASNSITPATLPTVTTQAATNVGATTATGNGNITATGGVNASAWGVCYKISTGCTTADSVAAGSGTGGTGAFTASLTTLLSGTLYYIKAYATNPAGTSYGSEVSTTTLPAAPTTVAATKTLSDKVTITWTKSTGATQYHVWRDAVDLGAAGDVATFDDTGAAAPTLTAGTASATDGSATDRVTLSISGASASNGTSYTYKVVASNSTGSSADSLTDTGYRAPGALTYLWYRSSGDADSGYASLGGTTAPYDDMTASTPTITPGAASASDGTSQSYVALSVSGQSTTVGAGKYYYATVSATGASSADTTHDRGYIGVGSLTYQWQRSAADSDAAYSDIVGATTASYNDTGAPADGSGRYFKVVENATGAAQQISTADRGYRLAPIYSISISPSGTIEYGYVTLSNATTTIGSTYTKIATNDGNTAEKLNVKSSDATVGTGWTLASTIGTNQFKHEFSTTTGSRWDVMPDSATYVTANPSVSVSGTTSFDFRLTVPSSSTDYQTKSITITVQAVAP